MSDDDVVVEFGMVEDLVRDAMISDERCRNYDKYLIFFIFRKLGALESFNGKDFLSFDKFMSLPSTETIRRNRAHIQNDYGDLLPTIPQILVKRRVREEHIRRYFSSNPSFIRDWESLHFGVK